LARSHKTIGMNFAHSIKSPQHACSGKGRWRGNWAPGASCLFRCKLCAPVPGAFSTARGSADLIKGHWDRERAVTTRSGRRCTYGSAQYTVCAEYTDMCHAMHIDNSGVVASQCPPHFCCSMYLSLCCSVRCLYLISLPRHIATGS